MANFASGHRTIYRDDLNKADVCFRKLARQVVGPPGDTDWQQPWHITLHSWDQKLQHVMAACDVQTWSTEALRQHWDLAAYVASLPRDRWVVRVLHCSPSGFRSQGRSCLTWETRLRGFCQEHCLGDWLNAAADGRAWKQMADDFISYMTG